MGINEYSSMGRKTNNGFIQKAVDEAKLGYYPTNEALAERLGKIFRLQEGTRAVCLEPSCGEAIALEKFLSAIEGGAGIDAYVVELDHTRAERAKKKPFVAACVEDDFVNGIIASNATFTLCFANPPYGESAVIKGERQETEFLRSITRYMAAGGYLVWIIPDACMRNTMHTKIWQQSWDLVKCYKFDEDEYAKYHQYAMILKKRKEKLAIDPEKVNRFIDVYSQCPYIPLEPQKKLVIEKSDAPKIFKSKEFHPELYLDEALKFTGLYGVIATPVYKSTSLYGKPPHQLKDESLYMCMACGVANGVIGSAEQKNLHLLKGRIEKVADEKIEGGDKVKIHVRETNQVRLTVITDQTIDEKGQRRPAEITRLK